MENQFDCSDEDLQLIMQMAYEDNLLGSFAEEILSQGPFPNVTETMFLQTVQGNVSGNDAPTAQKAVPSTSSAWSQSSSTLSQSSSALSQSSTSSQSAMSDSSETSISSASYLISEKSAASSSYQSYELTTQNNLVRESGTDKLIGLIRFENTSIGADELEFSSNEFQNATLSNEAPESSTENSEMRNAEFGVDRKKNPPQSSQIEKPGPSSVENKARLSLESVEMKDQPFNSSELLQSFVGCRGELPSEVKSEAEILNEKIHNFTQDVDRPGLNEQLNASSEGQNKESEHNSSKTLLHENQEKSYRKPSKRQMVDQTTLWVFKKQAKILPCTITKNQEEASETNEQSSEKEIQIQYENYSVKDGDTASSGEQSLNILDSFNVSASTSSSGGDINGVTLQNIDTKDEIILSQNNADSNDEVVFLGIVRNEVEYLGETTIPPFFTQLQIEISQCRNLITWPRVVLDTGKLPGDAILIGDSFKSYMMPDILLLAFCASVSILRRCRIIKGFATYFYYCSCYPFPSLTSCINYFFTEYTQLEQLRCPEEPRHPSGRTFFMQLLHELEYPENSTVPPCLKNRDKFPF